MCLNRWTQRPERLRIVDRRRQFDGCFAERRETLADLLVDEFAIFEVVSARVRRAPDRVRAEEREHWTEFLIDREEVVVRRAGRDEPDRRVLEGSDVALPLASRNHVEEVLERARVRAAVHRRADDIGVRLDDQFERLGGVALVVVDAATVSGREVVVGEVEHLRLDVVPVGRRVQRDLDRGPRPGVGGDAADDPEERPVRHLSGHLRAADFLDLVDRVDLVGVEGVGLVDRRDDRLTEAFELRLEVEEAREDDVDADRIQLPDPLDDLVVGPDESGLEAVVVLHEVLEVGVGPHPLALARRLAGLLHLVFERVDRLVGGVLDDPLQDLLGLRLGVALDDERVRGEPRRLRAELLGVLLDVVDDGADLLEAPAVDEEHIRVFRGHLPSRLRVPALEHLWVRILHRFGLQRRALEPLDVLPDRVEPAVVGRALLSPQRFQHLDELRRAGVPLVVFEPRLAESGELPFKPAGDDVDREPSVADAVGRGDEVRQRAGLPQPGVDRADHV